MIAPENRPKTPFLVKFGGQKQTNYVCPGNFQKKQPFFVNFRGKEFNSKFKLFCPAKLSGQTMPRICPATIEHGNKKFSNFEKKKIQIFS